MVVLTCASAFAANIKGMITSRTGNTLTVKFGSATTTVFIDDRTRTKDDRGLFGLREDELSNIVLIPGLKVDIEGSADNQGRITAQTITVDGDDLETAEMIQAGLHPTAEQVAANMQALEIHEQEIARNRRNASENKTNIAANKNGVAANKQAIEQLNGKVANSASKTQVEQNIRDIQAVSDRFDRLDDYLVKSQATVNFKVGSSTLSPEALKQLKQFAKTATGVDGYIVEVKGFADSKGSALMNEKLSEERAKRVVSFLIQQGNIPVWRIVAPGAMGEYQPVASNESSQGRAENRRVEVKILVNKAVSGKG
jgi:outer membrane protein OmpA-like peptidoglycan-associated protein